MAKWLENFWGEVEGLRNKKWQERENERHHSALRCLQGLQSWLQLEKLQVKALGRRGAPEKGEE